MNPLDLPPETIAEFMGRLTPRQIDVITHIANGRTHKETAMLLSINRRVVRRCMDKARAKIGAENRIQLIAVFVAWKYAGHERRG